jgi:hypothetical protein
MATTDITAPLARMKTLIEQIPNIGPVYPFDIFSRTDLGAMIVTNIQYTPTMRAWWISGPTMVGRRMVSKSSGWLERTWRYSIYGIEGLSDDGDSLVTIRKNALAVADAIDIEHETPAASTPDRLAPDAMLRTRMAGCGLM